MRPARNELTGVRASALLGIALAAVALACCARSRVAAGADPVAATLGRADAELRAGCYRCFEEAARLYALVPAGHPASGRARQGRFQSLLLLAIRARELGLPDEGRWLEEATTAAAAATDDGLAALRLEIAGIVQRPVAVASPKLLEAERADARQRLERLTPRVTSDLVPRAAHDPVDAYLLLALACERLGPGLLPTSGNLPGPDTLTPEIGAVPLVAFKAGACWRDHREAIAQVLDGESRFAEARVWQGEQALSDGRLVTADRELRLALDAFPDLRMASFSLGHVALLLEEHEAAAAAFEHVLAGAPDQPQALLGRTRALTYLRRAAEAIETADRLLAAGTWLQGEAHYWRAWNLRVLKRLEEAAAAVERAAPLLFNAAVPKLAGFIAYERDLLDQAERELDTSLERNGEDCEVLFGLGQVHGRRGEWAESAPFFARAADCARAAQEAVRTQLAEVDAADLDEPRKARMRARLERDLRAAYDQEGLAAITAAAGFVLAGAHDDARRAAERAEAWEAHRARAAELLAGLR